MAQILKEPKLSRAHNIGGSYAVTLEAKICRELGVNGHTFFTQSIVPQGILLKMHKLDLIEK
jgi:hypothetical protein